MGIFNSNRSRDQQTPDQTDTAYTTDVRPPRDVGNGAHPPAQPHQTPQFDERHLPINAETGNPIAPMAQPGYYPGYETLSQQAFWDEATRKVVLHRVHEPPAIRFFTPEGVRLMEAIVNRILPQDDRDEQHRIPIVPFIDQTLFTGKIDGYRYENMPPEREAIRLGMHGIEAIAQHLFGASFVMLDPGQQDLVLKTIHDKRPPAGEEYWGKMSVEHFWVQLVTWVVEVYYAHPYAWDEIGFGGPAYPRGYMRLERGQPEPWEVHERRYEWQAPPGSLSDRYEQIGLESAEEEQLHGHGSSGGGGTH